VFLRWQPRVPSAACGARLQSVLVAPYGQHTVLMKRRRFVLSVSTLGLGLASGLPLANGAETAFEVRDLDVAGEPKLAPRARLLVPKRESERKRVLVLLHGRGEVGNEALALRAWPELYGLVESDARLRQGRVTPTLGVSEQAYSSEKELAQWEQELAAQSYRGMAFVCPMTPNPAAHGSREQTLERYARWLTEQLLAAVRQQLPEAREFALAGCSMGGAVALEAFTRWPNPFVSLSLLQGAFGEWRASIFAERLAQRFSAEGAKPVQLLTSTGDPYRAGNEALAKESQKRGYPLTLEVPRGPHNQPFLRQVGTLLLLRWQAAAFSR
jgi:pimeloyl-ACP methyl ester carboxylesterase